MRLDETTLRLRVEIPARCRLYAPTAGDLSGACASCGAPRVVHEPVGVSFVGTLEFYAWWRDEALAAFGAAAVAELDRQAGWS